MNQNVAPHHSAHLKTLRVLHNGFRLQNFNWMLCHSFTHFTLCAAPTVQMLPTDWLKTIKMCTMFSMCCSLSAYSCSSFSTMDSTSQCFPHMLLRWSTVHTGGQNVHTVVILLLWHNHLCTAKEEKSVFMTLQIQKRINIPWLVQHASNHSEPKRLLLLVTQKTYILIAFFRPSSLFIIS